MGIYKIRNLLNGKIYIGQSISIKRRFANHKANLNKNYNYSLYNAFRKYGIENFEFIIVEQVHDIAKLDEREQFWINHYKSNDRNFGYNLRLHCTSNKGFKHTKETINKRILANTGKKRSLEFRKATSERMKGNILSIDTRNKIAKTLTGKKQSENQIKNATLTRIGSRRNKETKQRMRDAAIKRIAEGKGFSFKKGNIPHNKDKKMSNEAIRKRSEAMKLKWQDSIYIEKMKQRKTRRSVILA